MAQTPRDTRHFNEQDVLHFIRQFPVVSLSRPDTAARYLAHHLEVARAMAELLALYPREKMEELEFFYACLMGQGTLDARLLADLCHGGAWRGVVLGSWLAMLTRDASALGPLRSVDLDALPHNRWIVELALALNDGQPVPDELRALVALVEELRALIDGLPRFAMPMRLAPTEEALSQLARDREHIRELYKTHGADAARAFLQQTDSHLHLMTHEQWRATLAVTPSELRH